MLHNIFAFVITNSESSRIASVFVIKPQLVIKANESRRYLHEA